MPSRLRLIPILFVSACLAAPTLQAQAPVIAPGGVVSAGLSVPSQLFLSPGAMFSIFGSNLAPSGTAAVAGSADLVNGALPTTLGHTCVQVNGVKAPLFAVYPTQINAQVPTSVPITGVTVQVIAACDSTPVASNSAFVPIQAASPEFFYLQTSAAGNNPIAAFDATLSIFVGPGDASIPFATAPAKPGDTVVLYATGLGPTNPATPAGTLPPSAAPLTSTYTLSLGGATVDPANIDYAGVAPGYAGLYQINFRIPQSEPAGPQVLSLTVAGVPSPAGAILNIDTGGCTLPLVTAFAAFPNQLTAAGSTQITWSVSGADSVSFSPSLGSTATNGSVMQTVSAPTTFVLTAVNSCGQVTSSLPIQFGAPAISGFQDTTGTPVTAVFAGDTVQLLLQNFGDPNTIGSILFQTADGLVYSYPLSPAGDGNFYFTAPLLAEATFTAPTPVQISARRLTGEVISGPTLNISLPTYSGDAAGDFAAYINGVVGSYTNAINNIGSASGNPMVAPTVTAGVMAYLGPLQTAAAQLVASGSAGSAKIPDIPSVAGSAAPTMITITAADVGLFLALNQRASRSATASGGAAMLRGRSGAVAGRGTVRPRASGSCDGKSVDEVVPLIPPCKIFEEVTKEFVENVAGLWDSEATLAEIYSALSELGPNALPLGAAAGEFAGPAASIATGVAIGTALGAVFCYSQPIWLNDVILSPNSVPNTSGMPNAPPTDVKLQAALIPQLGPAAQSVGQALMDFGNAFLPEGEGATNKLARAATGYFLNKEESLLNELLKPLFQKVPNPPPQYVTIGYCGDDLTSVIFPDIVDMADEGPAGQEQGENDFFVSGVMNGQNDVAVFGNEENFLLASSFACPGKTGGFACFPYISVGPEAPGVYLGQAYSQAMTCTQLPQGGWLESNVANSTPPGAQQGLDLCCINAPFAVPVDLQHVFAVSAQQSPQFASARVYQVAPNTWSFWTNINMATPDCSSAATFEAVGSLLLYIMTPSSATVNVTAAGYCGADIGSPIGVANLTSLTNDHSQDQVLRQNATPASVTWTTNGIGTLQLAVGPALYATVQFSSPPQQCQVFGTIQLPNSTPDIRTLGKGR